MTEALLENEIVEYTIEGDALNRQHFVNQVKNVIEVLSKNKKNSCFAISGSWGVGKSYVIEKIEKQLLYLQDEKTILDRYFVFHFNCWEYDYYEEPLIAIVASMLDEIRTKENLFSEKSRARVLSAAQFVLSKLYEDGSKWFANQTGINPKEIIDGLSEINSIADKKIEDAHKYDKYLDFKQALSTLRDEITAIASEKTVIFVVDELDRCIPEYQVKVLERIHHIFNGIDNMQVILAVDKSQLERTIQKMFGEKVDTKRYLAKFIKFEIELDEGTYSNQFEELLGYYFDQFEETNNPQMIEFKENIFNGIPVRERIEIVEKCNLLHNLLNNPVEHNKAEFMCVELFLTIINHNKSKLPHKENSLVFTDMFGKDVTDGLVFLERKMSRKIQYTGGFERYAYYSWDGGNKYIYPSDIWGILVGCYATITETTFGGYINNRSIMDYIEEYSKLFWVLLKTIK